MYHSEKLAENIRAELKKKRISQKELLETCELGVNTIAKLSNGTDIMVKNLVKIADALNCSIDFLLDRETDLSPKSNTITNSDIDFLHKLHSLAIDSQDEIVHMTNYKYEQLQKKRKETSSPIRPTLLSDSQDMLAWVHTYLTF